MADEEPEKVLDEAATPELDATIPEEGTDASAKKKKKKGNPMIYGNPVCGRRTGAKFCFDAEKCDKNVDAPQLDEVASVRLGAMGTRRWKRGEIIWAANNGLSFIAVSVGITALIYFEFVLAPLTISYFMTFLLAPVMNVFEHRPFVCGKTYVCEPLDHSSGAKNEDGEMEFKYSSPLLEDNKIPSEDGGGFKFAGCMFFLFRYGAMGHGMALLACIISIVAGFAGLV